MILLDSDVLIDLLRNHPPATDGSMLYRRMKNCWCPATS